MQVGQIITAKSGDKKGEIGTIIAIDFEKQRVQVKWPKGFCNTWVKFTSVI